MIISGYRQYSLPLAQVFSLGSASGNKHGLGEMETAYIPHNHTLTVYCNTVHKVTANTCLQFEILPDRKITNDLPATHEASALPRYL